jgi:hypothetical protein
MPGEVGYEPAGVFTPDLRELDHYRYHAQLLPQVVGHTASQRGDIRYAPGSWLRRDYIAIDVGRQHGTGNGGLLLTDFGWVAVTPGGPARLVEITPLFVEQARQASDDAWREGHSEPPVRRMLRAYFQAAKPNPKGFGEVQEALFSDLAPEQVVALERFLTTIRRTGQCVIVTDLDEMLTAFSGGPLADDMLDVVAAYLGAGGMLVFSTDTAFEWLYARLLRPLVVKLGPRSRLLGNVLLILPGGEIFMFEDGAFVRVSRAASRDRSGGVEALVNLSTEDRPGLPVLDPTSTAFISDSRTSQRIDHAKARTVCAVIDVGDAMPTAAGRPITDLHRSYRRTLDVIVAATAALGESGSAAPLQSSPEVGDTILWTFERPHFPPGRRLRVRVGGSGFVHAGVSGPDGTWNPVYNVPLLPVPEGEYEALLPCGVNAFTFFWTEAPWTSGHPGHWERDRRGARVFTPRG